MELHTKKQVLATSVVALAVTVFTNAGLASVTYVPEQMNTTDKQKMMQGMQPPANYMAPGMDTEKMMEMQRDMIMKTQESDTRNSRALDATQMMRGMQGMQRTNPTMVTPEAMRKTQEEMRKMQYNSEGDAPRMTQEEMLKMQMEMMKKIPTNTYKPVQTDPSQLMKQDEEVRIKIEQQKKEESMQILDRTTPAMMPKKEEMPQNTMQSGHEEMMRTMPSGMPSPKPENMNTIIDQVTMQLTILNQTSDRLLKQLEDNEKLIEDYRSKIASTSETMKKNRYERRLESLVKLEKRLEEKEAKLADQIEALEEKLETLSSDAAE